MTDTVQEVDSDRSRSRSVVVIGVLVAAVLALVVAYEFGQRHPPVKAEVLACLSAEGDISCGYEDSPNSPVLSVPRDVAWTDAGGKSHLGGRPSCLPPVGIGTILVEVSWVDVRHDGGTSHGVTSVDCLS